MSRSFLCASGSGLVAPIYCASGSSLIAPYYCASGSGLVAPPYIVPLIAAWLLPTWVRPVVYTLAEPSLAYGKELEERTQGVRREERPM